MRANFERSMQFVYVDERGNDDDPADRGGRTSDGITQREYDAWNKLHHAPPGDVWKASWETKKAIYLQQYWLPYCDAIPTGLDYLFFDAFVNHGFHQAALLLQRALGVKADGHFGLVTAQAMRETQVTPALVNKFCDDHLRVYHAIVTAHPTDKKFLHGWENRVAHERKNALELLGHTAPAPAVPPTEAPKTEIPKADVPPQSAPAAPAKERTMPAQAQSPSTFQDIEGALEAAGSFLPSILSVIGAIYPPAGLLIRFLPLLQVAIQGVQVVAQATGQSTAQATVAVQNHLTPNAPNAAALGPNSTPSKPA